jgi:deoxyribodipyrimidine photo-lyase
MTTSYKDIIEKLESIRPIEYGKNRNFIDGSVTRLSPYISRGVISTKQVYQFLKTKDYPYKKIEKFIQELAWRDYWQQIWIEKGTLIDNDFKKKQEHVKHHGIPKSIVEGNTSIEAIDKAINDFYNSGYLHNHLRMYIASIACNIGKSHWKKPAQWMYYHLLDGDWASNSLSWQWVAGSNSNKLYYANQDNINTYCRTNQKNTFLDVEYHQFPNLEIPQTLHILDELELTTPLPKMTSEIMIDESKPTLIYNFYNLDPLWKSDIDANRILLIEPSIFEAYPVSKKSIDFMMDLSKNIDHIQYYVGEFDDFKVITKKSSIYFKEHPLNRYSGNEEKRDCMFDVNGYYPSFFKFWNKCKKYIK